MERNRLVEQWIHLPLWFVKRYRNHPVLNGIDCKDAISDGYLALLSAAEQWDETRGVGFVTYATHAIYRRIQGDNKSRLGAVRVPNCAWRSKYKQDAIKARGILSLVYADWSEIPAREEEEPAEIPDRVREALSVAMKQLTPQERGVIVDHFYNGKPLSELAANNGNTRAWYSLLKIRALQKLRILMRDCPL